jgi:hypothetical protein
LLSGTAEQGNVGDRLAAALHQPRAFLLRLQPFFSGIDLPRRDADLQRAGSCRTLHAQNGGAAGQALQGEDGLEGMPDRGEDSVSAAQAGSFRGTSGEYDPHETILAEVGADALHFRRASGKLLESENGQQAEIAGIGGRVVVGMRSLQLRQSVAGLADELVVIAGARTVMIVRGDPGFTPMEVVEVVPDDLDDFLAERVEFRIVTVRQDRRPRDHDPEENESCNTIRSGSHEVVKYKP